MPALLDNLTQLRQELTDAGLPPASEGPPLEAVWALAKVMDIDVDKPSLAFGVSTFVANVCEALVGAGKMSEDDCMRWIGHAVDFSLGVLDSNN